MGFTCLTRCHVAGHSWGTSLVGRPLPLGDQLAVTGGPWVTWTDMQRVGGGVGMAWVYEGTAARCLPLSFSPHAASAWMHSSEMSHFSFFKNTDKFSHLTLASGRWCWKPSVAAPVRWRCNGAQLFPKLTAISWAEFVVPQICQSMYTFQLDSLASPTKHSLPYSPAVALSETTSQPHSASIPCEVWNVIVMFLIRILAPEQ